MKMWSSAVPTLLFITAICAGLTSALTPLQHIVNHCGKSVYVNNSLLLDLTEDLEPDRVLVGHLSCAVTLQGPPGSRLFLHVLQLAISESETMPDRLHIYEVTETGQIKKRLTPNTGLYGVLERPFLIYNTAGIIVPDFRSSEPRMRLDYQGKPTIVFRGFRVLVTTFYNQGSDGTCRSGTLYCPYAGMCIPVSTRCDDMPNCGLDDDYDERGCQRQDVVTGLVEQYSIRTAIIAAASGIVVFLGAAALVFFIVTRHNRRKYGGNREQTVEYSSRGGRETCRYRNETDLTNLYAPPSYEDVMTPADKEDLRKTAVKKKYGSGPPPTYSAAVAALIHQEGHLSDSSGDESGQKKKSRGHPRHKHRHVHYHGEPPPSFEMTRLQGKSPQCTDSEGEELERVRVSRAPHVLDDAWPSDTDEDEAVKAQKRRKGGKCKNRRSGTASDAPCNASSRSKSSSKSAAKPKHKCSSQKRRALPGPGYQNVDVELGLQQQLPGDHVGSSVSGSVADGGCCSSETSKDVTTSSCSCSPSQSSSPELTQTDEKNAESPSSSTPPPPSDQSDCIHSNGSSPSKGSSDAVTSSREGVSETESQQLAGGSKRNSITESISPGGSSRSSIHDQTANTATIVPSASLSATTTAV